MLLKFPLLLAALAVAPRAELLTAGNSALTVGVDLSLGGGISRLLDNNSPSLNLINTHDEGRFLQQSYYSGPDPYRGAHWSGHPWPWNPVSSGDAFSNTARIIRAAVRSGGRELYVKSQPLQWALKDVPCNCTFETTVFFPEWAPANSFVVNNTLTMYREDQTDYRAMSQEEPALYTVPSLSKLWTYAGNAPWSNGALTQVSYPKNGTKWARFNATENWAALTDDSPGNYGVGVMHSGVDVFLGGLAGDPGSWSSKSDSTGYLAPVPVIALPGRSVHSYQYCVAVGYLADIRGAFAKMRNVYEVVHQ